MEEDSSDRRGADETSSRVLDRRVLEKSVSEVLMCIRKISPNCRTESLRFQMTQVGDPLDMVLGVLS